MDKLNTDWNGGGRVPIHVILVFALMGLCWCSTSRSFSTIAAYVPVIFALPILAIAITVVSLYFTFACKTGKNLHLIGSLAIAVLHLKFNFEQSSLSWLVCEPEIDAKVDG